MSHDKYIIGQKFIFSELKMCVIIKKVKNNYLIFCGI